MTERYPTDASLLALTTDSETGVEYIATGQSPYYLQFRRMLYRLLLASKRANDLRVYQDGDLTIGVRPGRFFVGGSSQNYAGTVAKDVTSDTTNYVYFDDAGLLQINTSGLPSDRSTFIPLAIIVADSDAILSITDLRAEAMFSAPSASMIGLTATPDEINQALDGIGANVTATNLDALVAGPETSANTLHRHTQFVQDVDGDAIFHFINNSSDSSANMLVRLSLPNLLPDDTTLEVNTNTGYLRQSYNGIAHDLVGSVHSQFAHEGDLTATISGKLIGVVPVSGEVVDVILSVGTNIVSDTSTDGLVADAKVNGVSLCNTGPEVTNAVGAGFRSTAQSDGTQAVLKSDGTQDVTRGDVLTVDLTRTAVGSISTEFSDIVVLIVIRNNRPE